MNKVSPIAVVLAVLLPVFALSSGCEEQRQPDIRKRRLIADENLRLTTELQRLSRQLDEQKKLLEDCRQEHKTVGQDSRELATSILTAFGECKGQNLQLQEENKNLKAKLKLLKDEIDEAEE
jgi:hypothetical protein